MKSSFRSLESFVRRNEMCRSYLVYRPTGSWSTKRPKGLSPQRMCGLPITRPPDRWPCSSCLHLLLLFSIPWGSPFCPQPSSRGWEAVSDIQARPVSWKIQLLVCSLLSAATLVCNIPSFITELLFFLLLWTKYPKQDTNFRSLTIPVTLYSHVNFSLKGKCSELSTVSIGRLSTARLKLKMCNASYKAL